MTQPAAQGFPSPQAPARVPKPPRRFNVNIFRATLWLLVALVALFTLSGLSSVGDPTQAASAISLAENTKVANDAATQGSPQQQVVNGWFVADTIPVLSEQLAGVHAAGIYTSRLYTLALIALLGACLDIAGRSWGAHHNQKLDKASQAQAESPSM